MGRQSTIDQIREIAGGFPEVGVGTVCGKDSFKARKKNFLFLGVDDRGCSLKLKLSESLAEAEALASREPGHYCVGPTGWVDVEWPHEAPPPEGVLERWIEESYRLNAPKSLVAQLD